MSNLRGSFERVREDIDSLRLEIDSLRESMIEIVKIIQDLKGNDTKDIQTDKPSNETNILYSQTNRHIIKARNDQIYPISTGNQGVQTDRQTNRQTDRHILEEENSPKNTRNEFSDALNALDSLDNLKKEIRLKFKNLTEKELLVFSTIYQIEEERGYSDYKTLSERLNLTQSSIRDYIRRLTLKNIPIDKIKVNNKEIHLKVSSELRKVTSLNTILSLINL